MEKPKKLYATTEQSLREMRSRKLNENMSAALEYGMEFEKSFNNLLPQLREQVEARKIKLLIGDDVSGRLPTLALSKALNELYDADQTKHPDVRFVAGSKFYKQSSWLDAPADLTEEQQLARQQELEAYVDIWTMHLGPGDTVIVVTEYIQTGAGLIPLVEALRKASETNSFNITICTMLMGGYRDKFVDGQWHYLAPEESLKLQKEKFKSAVLCGRVSATQEGELLINNTSPSGVYKDDKRNVFTSRRVRGFDDGSDIHRRLAHPELAATHREVIAQVAHNAVEQYKRSSPNT